MMSENSSFSNFIALQKNITKRRRWLVILAFVTFILYDVGVLLLVLNSARQSEFYVINVISSIKGFLGNNGLNRVSTIVGSVMLGIEGFRWLSNRKMIDFYESQPFSRTEHFIGVAVNSALILFLSHFAGTMLGIIVSAIPGYCDGSLVKAAFECLGQDITIFAAAFSVTTLAVSLTGNLLVSVIAAIVLLVYEPLFKFCLNMTIGTLPTYGGDTLPYKGIFSPILGVIDVKFIWPVGNLICAAVTLFIAFALYRYRRNEDTGKTVPLKAVRIITKIAVIFLVVLLTGDVFSSGNPISTGIISMIISMVVVGGIMEAIYNSDVRKIFRGSGYTVIGGALAIALLLSCRYDLFGYSRWVPDKDDVASASISTSFDAKSMKLTDIDTVNALLKAGEENTKDGDKGMFFLDITYRMKDGSTKSRKVLIPESAKDLMNKIITSDEFKQGFFKVYRDQDIYAKLDKVVISYNSFGSEDSSRYASSSAIYDDLKAAYIKDLAKYDFETAGYKPEIGEVNIQVPGKENDHYYDLPVYDTFTNTIAFLKAQDMYSEPQLSQNADNGYYGPFSVGQTVIIY